MTWEAKSLEHACQIGRWLGGHRDQHPDDDSVWPKNLAPMVSVQMGWSLELHKRQLILACYDKFEGNQTRTAVALGISRNTLWEHLRCYGVLPIKPINVIALAG